MVNKIKTIIKEKSLVYKNSKLAKEWHQTKNGKLFPNNVTVSSAKKVWWKCKKGHEWQATIAHRNNGRKCPYCMNKRANKENCISSKKPNLLKEWDYKRNKDISPNMVVFGSTKKVWWKCKNGHSWEAEVRNRYMGQGCPYCCNPPRKVDIANSLSVKMPKLAKEWHLTKNGKLTPKNVTYASNQKRWWKCKKKGHTWEASIYSRVVGNNCPYCSGRRACKDNCLATLEPKISKEWDYKKNGKLTPKNVTCHTHKKVWWKCKNKHEWLSSVSNRTGTYGTGCPKCRGINLKGGIHCDSIPEAYMYLQYKIKKYTFLYNKIYDKGLGKRRYDFYFPNQNKYIEVTSFSKNNKKKIGNNGWKKYYSNILKKKNYVENILKAKFEFIQFIPTKKQINFVEINSI